MTGVKTCALPIFSSLLCPRPWFVPACRVIPTRGLVFRDNRTTLNSNVNVGIEVDHISFVDENELVCFYSDTDHRIFPRSKNVIGREVMNCHPRKSAHIVREVIDKLRSGEQDKVEFWINKPGLFIYIIYVALRDKDGKFRGVLEMMQDCTHIRALEGSQNTTHMEQRRCTCN